MVESSPTQLVAMAAGIGASAAWVCSSLAFGAAANRIGPTLVNGLRLAFAVTILWMIHTLVRGTPVPHASEAQVLFLAISGLIGLTIGDQLFFHALVDMGPRLSLLVSMTTSPLFAAALGVGVLGERLRALDCLGICMAIAGIAWVITERSGANEPTGRARHTRAGLLCALGAGACQATGGLFSKMAMTHHGPGTPDISPLGATAWRMGFGFVFVIPIVIWHLRRARVRAIAEAASDAKKKRIRQGVTYTGMGAVCGPVLGVWMSLTAYAGVQLGIAQTLCSLSPVLVLPVLIWTGRDRVTVRAAMGAAMAIGGCAILFLSA